MSKIRALSCLAADVAVCESYTFMVATWKCEKKYEKKLIRKSFTVGYTVLFNDACICEVIWCICMSSRYFVSPKIKMWDKHAHTNAYTTLLERVKRQIRIIWVFIVKLASLRDNERREKSNNSRLNRVCRFFRKQAQFETRREKIANQNVTSLCIIKVYYL